MWSVWLVFCDCGFHSVCPLRDKDKRLMEVSWWEKLTDGETGSCSDGWGQAQSVEFGCSVMFDSATPWTAACQASLSITNAQSLLKLMSIESVMLSNHLILCQIHSKKSCALHEISLIIFPENRILKFSNWTDEIVIPSVFRMFITMLPC